MKSGQDKNKYLWALLFVTALIGGMVLIETAAQIGVRAKSLLSHFNSFQEYYVHLQKFDALEMLRYDVKRHPYFGYVSRQGNNEGFRTQYNFPLIKNKDDFFIGFFGGSVAERFASKSSDAFIQALKEKLPKLKNKNVKLVNFALGGYKQPQPYLTFTFFCDQLDMAVQIDGWNEVFLRPSLDFSLDFPNDAAFLFSDDDELYKSVDWYATIRRGITRYTAFLSEHPLLNKSATVFLLAHATEQYLREESEAIIQKADESHVTKERDITTEQVNIWVRYLKLQHLLADFKKVPLFSFIQPNQYAVPGKLLTQNERNCCFKPEKRPVEPFNLLRARAKELLQDVPRLFDLNDLFVGEAQEMYADDCCHLNKNGNLLMADQMTKLIAKHFGSKGFTNAKATK